MEEAQRRIASLHDPYQVLHILELADVLTYTQSEMCYIVAISNDTTDLLLSIPGNRVCECLVDTTLLQELVALARDVDRIELQST